MRIKIGDQIFDGSDQPIMVVLDETDRKNIANMPESATRYCLHPPMMDQKELDAWMNNPGQIARVIEGKLCIKDKVKTVRIFGTVKPDNEEQGIKLINGFC